ncbi:MAG: SCO family protein [Chitinophagaceae bacterium]|nr:SCO family protein [Chitinophagaceae bacterium]
MTPVSKYMSLFLIIIFTIGMVWLAGQFFSPGSKLPVLGEPGHTAGGFSFINQQGERVTEEAVKGKVTVVEYFFTHCTGICPVMTGNLRKVYDEYKGKKDFTILSHSVDPERDSVPVMAVFAARIGARPPTWQFLTGDKEALYKAARQDYLLAVEDTVTASLEQDFIHTEYVALLDKERKIRGVYNATDSTSIEKLIEDIKELL